ncbi:MAG: hypothetical protein K8F60_17935 [Melioribacteraceae bacterium]|nr:hypothetical protein [Melioribacteraceae bacterium]
MTQSLSQANLTYKKIFYFWMPLAATWLMMSVEGPFLASIIARLAEPKYNLAAYGIAFSFALVIESPIIMLLSAATELVNDFQSFMKLRNFTYVMNTILTAVYILFIIPPIFYFIAERIIGLPDEVAHLTHIASIILIPWPGAIGYRRFYQGILIKYNYTKRVSYGTVVRLVSMAVTAVILFSFFNLPGVVVGAVSLSVAVVSESIASRFMTVNLIKQIRESESSGEDNLSYSSIIKFYYPLALTSVMALGVHPIVTFFLGQSRMSLESLAVMPVVNSLVFIFRSVGLSYQEVGIALIGKKADGYKKLRNFAFFGGISAASTLLLIGLTPLSDFWLFDVSGLTKELADFASLPVIIMGIMPALTFLISFQRAVLVHERRTTQITYATIIEVSGIVISLFAMIYLFDSVGAVAATASYILGRIAANTFLMFPFSKAVKNYP